MGIQSTLHNGADPVQIRWVDDAAETERCLERGFRGKTQKAGKIRTIGEQRMRRVTGHFDNSVRHGGEGLL